MNISLVVSRVLCTFSMVFTSPVETSVTHSRIAPSAGMTATILPVPQSLVGDSNKGSAILSFTYLLGEKKRSLVVVNRFSLTRSPFIKLSFF